MAEPVPLVLTSDDKPDVVLTKDADAPVEKPPAEAEAEVGTIPAAAEGEAAVPPKEDEELLQVPEPEGVVGVHGEEVTELKADEADKAEDRAAIAELTRSPTPEGSEPYLQRTMSPTRFESPGRRSTDSSPRYSVDGSSRDRTSSFGYFGFNRRSSTASNYSSFSERLNYPSPLARTSAQGPPVPASSVTAPVRATNPVLEEVLHALSLLLADSEELTELDLSDCQVFTSSHAESLAEGLTTNIHLRKLSLKNTKLQTDSAIQIANALRDNSTLELLNLERNQIGPLGVKAVAEMLRINNKLMDLRLNDQKSLSGTDAEQQLAKSLSENKTLQRFSLQIRDMASRNAIDRAITRNKDIARKKRLEAAKAAASQ